MRFKEKMYRFAYGRYGTDELYSFSMIVLAIVWIAEIIAVAVVPEGVGKTVMTLVFGAIITFLLAWTMFRMLSKNIARRRRENQIYLRARRAIARFFSFNTSTRTHSRNRDDYSYIFRDCTKCGSVLRLPRRVGKHKVICPRCSHEFNVKAKKYKAPKYR